MQQTRPGRGRDSERVPAQQARPGRKTRRGSRRSKHAQWKQDPRPPQSNRALTGIPSRPPPIPQARLMRKEPLEMGSNTASASNRGRTSETPPLPHKAVAPLLGPKPTFPPKQQAHPGRRRGSERLPAQQARPIEANPETPPCSRRSLLERKSNLMHSKHVPTEELPVRRRRQRGYKAPRPLYALRRRRPADEAETRGGERKAPHTPLPDNPLPHKVT